MTTATAPKPTALDLATVTHADLVRLAEISDRLDLHPVAVSLTANTYGGRRISVQFGHDDCASVDKLGHEVGIPVLGATPTLYDRKGVVGGIEWSTFCGVTVNDDIPEVSR